MTLPDGWQVLNGARSAPTEGSTYTLVLSWEHGFDAMAKLNIARALGVGRVVRVVCRSESEASEVRDWFPKSVAVVVAAE